MYLTLLNAQASAAAGTGQHISGIQSHSDIDTSKQLVQVEITGAPTAVTVSLNVSVKGNNYGVAATHIFTASELTATFAVFAIDAGIPSEWLQGEVVTLTGGSSPTVSMYVFWGQI